MRVLLRHLVHDLRQPLGSIESIAFFLDMVLAGADSRVKEQCLRLRQLVAQANWLLEDATLYTLCAGEPLAPVDLNGTLRQVAERRTRQDQRPPDLRLCAESSLVLLPAGRAPILFEHLCSLFADVAGVCEPVQVQTSLAGDRLLLRMSGVLPPEANVEEVARPLVARSAHTGLSRLASSLGGALETRCDPPLLAVDLFLPIAEHPLD
jgi:signal transduction histidine kinase